MTDLSQRDPTGRFTGLANQYALFRPSYPAEAIDFIRAHCQLRPGSVVVDIGCGTGISSRLFGDLGLQVIGVEPNAEMRQAAILANSVRDAPQIDYRDGRAEATGLDGATANLVVVAQSFHWFQPEPTLREFHRLLKPSGWAALIWNERDERDPFTTAYGAVIRTARDAAAIERPRQASAGNALLNSPLFHHPIRAEFPNSQELDENGLLGRSFSVSYAPRDRGEAAAWSEQLRAVFATHQQNGRVVLRYTTSIYLGQRR
jgi:SAM-dependent methyltransferase